MTRPSFLLFGALLACFPGCASRDASPPPPPSSFGAAPSGPALAARPVPRAGVGTAAAPRTFSAPPPSPATRDCAAVAEACRRDADRIVQYRDRGQLMREDERDARIGTDASIYARRIETDRLGRAFDRDRIAAECLEQQDARPTLPAPSPRR